MILQGHDIYIMTGSSHKDAEKELKQLKINPIKITKIISTTDYLLEKGYPWEYDKYNRPSFADSIWWGAKAEIAQDLKLDLHIDDRLEYQDAFTTPFLLWTK